MAVDMHLSASEHKHITLLYPKKLNKAQLNKIKPPYPSPMGLSSPDRTEPDGAPASKGI